MASTITKAARRGARGLRRVALTPVTDAPAATSSRAVETIAERRARFPTFRAALKEDARMYAAGRGERHEFRSRADLLGQCIRLAWTSDSFLAFELYRAKAAMQAGGVPVLPRLAHHLAMVIAQVSIGDEVIVHPGVYLPHGQVVIDGRTEVHANCDIRPWVTIAPEPGGSRGPTIEKGASLGTGCQVIGPVVVGVRALVGANAAVSCNVPSLATAVGAPATILPPRNQRRAPVSDDDATRAAVRSRPDSGTTDPEVLARFRPLFQAGSVAEAEGRLLDAIELFSEANRVDRRHKLEMWLVSLRHRAFVDHDRTPGRPSWPPTFADPFPGVTGHVEVAAADLTAELIGGAVMHHGGLIVRGLVPDDTVDQLRTDIDLAFAACDLVRSQGKGAHPVDYYSPFNPPPPYAMNVGERGWVRSANGVLTADSPPVLFDLIEALDAAGIPPMLAEYFGERPAFSINKSTLRRSKGSDPTWHQDGSFLGPDVRTLDVWLSLSHCGGTTNTVGLDTVPRRIDELLPTGTHGAFFPNSIGQGVVDEFLVETPMLTPLFAPGDAIIFDDLFLHRTSVAEGLTEERYAIESWFFAPSAFPTQYSPLLL